METDDQITTNTSFWQIIRENAGFLPAEIPQQLRAKLKHLERKSLSPPDLQLYINANRPDFNAAVKDFVVVPWNDPYGPKIYSNLAFVAGHEGDKYLWGFEAKPPQWIRWNYKDPDKKVMDFKQKCIKSAAWKLLKLQYFRSHSYDPENLYTKVHKDMVLECFSANEFDQKANSKVKKWVPGEHHKLLTQAMPKILKRWEQEKPQDYPSQPYDAKESEDAKAQRMAFWKEQAEDKDTLLEFYYTLSDVLDWETICAQETPGHKKTYRWAIHCLAIGAELCYQYPPTGSEKDLSTPAKRNHAWVKMATDVSNNMRPEYDDVPMNADLRQPGYIKVEAQSPQPFKYMASASRDSASKSTITSSARQTSPNADASPTAGVKKRKLDPEDAETSSAAGPKKRNASSEGKRLLSEISKKPKSKGPGLGFEHQRSTAVATPVASQRIPFAPMFPRAKKREEVDLGSRSFAESRKLTSPYGSIPLGTIPSRALSSPSSSLCSKPGLQ